MNRATGTDSLGSQVKLAQMIHDALSERSPLVNAFIPVVNV